MTDESTAKKRPRLPVLATVILTYATFFNNLGAFSLAARWWLALQISLGLGLGAVRYLGPPSQIPRANLALVLIALGLLILVGVSSGMAVTWHQFLILREKPPRGFPTMGANFLVHFSRSLVLGFAVVGVPIALFSSAAELLGLDQFVGLIPPVLLSCAVVGFSLAVGRLCLAFPAAAIGEERMTFAASWKFTNGNSWRLLAGGLLAFFPTLILGQLVTRAIADQLFDPWPLFLFTRTAAGCVALMATGGLTATYASLAYQFLVERRNDPNSGANLETLEELFS